MCPSTLKALNDIIISCRVLDKQGHLLFGLSVMLFLKWRYFAETKKGLLHIHLALAAEADVIGLISSVLRPSGKNFGFDGVKKWASQN